MRSRLVPTILVVLVLSAAGFAAAPVIAQDDSADECPAREWLVEYQRTGGFAGFNDILRIDHYGNGTLTRRGAESTVALDPDELANLITVLETADFPTLEPEYRAIGVVSDGFTYTITHAGVTVRTETTAVPAVLEPVIRVLDGIIASTPR